MAAEPSEGVTPSAAYSGSSLNPSTAGAVPLPLDKGGDTGALVGNDALVVPGVDSIIADATVTKLDNETVSYYYDSKTTLEYSLTYTGFKEDIVVSEYTGQTEYHFLLETGGLTLTKIDESYYLTDSEGTVKATLGDIIIFTADEQNNTLGSMTHTMVKENEQYIITIHIDAEYLKDEKTKYPIRIDPTIEITYDSNGASAIEDVTLNELSGSSGTSGSLYVGKRNTYGISRTLMKFPGLDISAIPSANNVISAYVEIRDLLCETISMTVYGCAFEGSVWSDSTANWNNANPERYLDLQNSYANVSYSNGNAKDPKHRYSIDITEAVRYWKRGSIVYTKDTGIMLKASYEVENGSSALYKTFASYNRASNKPSLKVCYITGEISISLDTNKGANMAVGQTRQINVQTDDVPTDVFWRSSDSSIASVTQTGLVTGEAPGTVDITVTYTFEGDITSTKSIRFYVKNSLGIVDNENYYIMNYASEKFLSLESATDVNGTNIIVRDRSTDAISKWQLSAKSNKEYYLINNGSSSGRVLTRESTNASVWSPIDPLPQYFTILRIDEGTYAGLYLICIGGYYLTQDSSGTNAYFATNTTSYSYWSLMQCNKGGAYLTSISYTNDIETFDTTKHNTLFSNTLTNKSYNVDVDVNPLPATAYSAIQNNQIFVSRGHGEPGAILFHEEHGVPTGSIVSNSDFTGTAPSLHYSITDLSATAMSDLRCVLYLGCSTGISVSGGQTSFNLVDETYKKGAHFVLGTTETVITGYSNSFLRGFLEGVSQGKNIEGCIASAHKAVKDDGYGGDYPIYKIGDEKQYLQ